MARRTKEEAERTRARIMASALSLFAKKGYDRTTFNDIAARLKLTKGAVYWHFESKQALLTALLDEMLSMIDTLVDGPFVEALKDVSLKFRGSSNQRIIKMKDFWAEREKAKGLPGQAGQ